MKSGLGGPGPMFGLRSTALGEMTFPDGSTNGHPLQKWAALMVGPVTRTGAGGKDEQAATVEVRILNEDHDIRFQATYIGPRDDQGIAIFHHSDVVVGGRHFDFWGFMPPESTQIVGYYREREQAARSGPIGDGDAEGSWTAAGD